MKQNPFSLYDFLGYFIPGALLIYIVIIIDYLKKTTNLICLDNILGNIPTLRLEGIILMLLISYSVGHILSFTSSITIEKYSVWRYGYPSRYLLDIEVPSFFAHFKTEKGFFWGSIMIIILFPTIILDYILGNLFGFKEFYVRPIDETLKKIIVLKINILAKHLGFTKKNGIKNGEGIKSDFFRIVQHFTFENSKHHQTKFTNYIALYGFLRTMSLIMNILFWYLTIHFIILWTFNWKIILSLIIVSIISYVFFMAFMKFYRRYTLEGFMVLIVDDIIK